MSGGAPNVLHVIGSDTSTARLETLKTLRARGELGRQHVVRFGGGHVECAGLGSVDHLSAPFGAGWLARRPLHSVVPPAGQPIVHVWSANALSWVVPAVAREERALYRLLVDAEFPRDFRRLVGHSFGLSAHTALRFVCPTDTVRRRLVKAGAAVDDCMLIRDSVDFAVLNEARRSDLRSQLGLARDATVVLVLPPVLRQTGAFVAAWAAMLLEKVWPGVRLIVPDEGREVRRVRRLTESCRHEWMLRLPGRRFALPELVASTDLTVYLPADDAPVSGLAWAMAAGRPIVASAIPTTTELLIHRQNAWLCRADSPKDAARRMLQSLANPQQSRQQAELARAQAFKVFSRQRMVDQYRRAYENLRTGRRPTDGIDDAALIR